jgi:hypothetical protein
MNEFKDLETTLKKAFAREKQQGLAPQQLRALHEAIDRGSSAGAKQKRRWWQWSVAGSLLATALVAIVVVDRFPRSQDLMTETAAPLAQEKKKSSKADKAAEAAPPAKSLADGRGARKDTPAETAPAQKTSDSGIAARKREARAENELAKQVQPKPAARPQAGVNAGPKPGGNKASGALQPSTGSSQWETKSQLSSAKTPQQEAQPKALSESSADKGPGPADDIGFSKGGTGGFGSAGSAGAALGGAGKSGLELKPATPAPAAPAKAKKKVAVEKESAQSVNYRVRIIDLSFKGKGKVSDLRKLVNAWIPDLQLCYNYLRTRSPDAHGDMTLVWQFPVFKIKISADAFADTAMRTCMTEKISRWGYPSGMEGNAEATLRFSHGK